MSTRLQTRRQFLARGVGLTAVGAILKPTLGGTQEAPPRPPRLMKLCLTPGSLGISANQMEAIELARRHGFEAVEPFGGHLASLSEGELVEVSARLQSAGLTWGAAGLPVEFRREDRQFEESLATFPKVAAALAKAGAQRVGTWLSPAHSSLTYLQNFHQHARRLKDVARVLRDHNLRLGLEYVGTRTLLIRRKYPFVHTLAETRELIAEIGMGNVGVILDSWHWWQAEDTVEEILALRREDVVSVDLNDAPVNVPKWEQVDGRRELPAATGVIDLGGFLKALLDIRYDGPVRAEPFNASLNELDNEQASAEVISALRRAVGN